MRWDDAPPILASAIVLAAKARPPVDNFEVAAWGPQPRPDGVCSPLPRRLLGSLLHRPGSAVVNFTEAPHQ
jgi:hypothetical protein